MASAGYPKITITHTATTHTYKFTAHFQTYRPNPGYPVSLTGHQGSPTGTCGTLDTASIWYGPLYAAPGCTGGTEWGSGASVIPPQDLIGQTAGQVNWGLISFAGDCASPAVLRVPVNSWDSGDVTAIEAMLKLANYGGLSSYSYTPTRGALSFAKTQLQSTFSQDPNISCGRTYGVVVLTGGLSNTCNPNDLNWIYPCQSWPYDCDEGTSGYDCDRRLGGSRNYTAFPPGVAEQVWYLNMTATAPPW